MGNVNVGIFTKVAQGHSKFSCSVKRKLFTSKYSINFSVIIKIKCDEANLRLTTQILKVPNLNFKLSVSLENTLSMIIQYFELTRNDIHFATSKNFSSFFGIIC